MRALLLATVMLAMAVNPRAATAAPPADLVEAYELVGRWLEAQNRHRFDDYAALYADGFEGIKRTASGKETSYALAAWKVDRKRGFEKISVEIFNEEYARLDGKTIGVVFRQAFRSGSYGDRGVKKLKLEKGASGLKIVREEIRSVGRLDPNEDEIQLPDDFADGVRARWGGCNKRHQCPVFAVLGRDTPEPKEDDPRRVALGVFRGEIEEEGSNPYRVTLVVTPLWLGELKGAAFVIAENFWTDATRGGQWNDSTVARRATLVGRGPRYPVLWSGDLLTWPEPELVKYKAGQLGAATQQLLPEAKERSPRPVGCRFATFSDESAKLLGAVYACGKSRTALDWRDGALH
jgi:hypothetical protein